MNRNMKKPKRILALLILVVMVLTVGIPGITYAATISDIGGHWAYKEISAWIEQGLISGYSNGTFRPEKPIIRVEFYRLINKAFKFTETEAVSFNDVKAKDWIYQEVAIAKKAGYVLVDGNNNARPKANISRQEIAVIITKIKSLQEDESKAEQYKDKNTFAASSKGSIGAITRTGIMYGYKDGTFGANKNATRAEAVVILTRALALKPIQLDAIPEQKVVAGATLKVAIKPNQADAVISAITSDEKIVSVAVKGMELELKGIAAGEAIITVKALKNKFMDGRLTFKVIVQAAAVSTPTPTPTPATTTNPPVNPPPVNPTPAPANSQPVITVIEPDGVNDGVITLTLGTAFVAPTVTANDAENGNITSRIVKVGENLVDISKAGEYVLRYNVTDLQGLAAAEKIVTVKVTNTFAATAEIKVEKSAVDGFKQVTVNSSSAGVRYKVEGSPLINVFGKAIQLYNDKAALNVYIIDVAGNVIGIIPLDVSKNSEKAYAYNATMISKIDATVNASIVVSGISVFAQVTVNSSVVGAKYKVQGSNKICLFGTPIPLYASDSSSVSRIVTILDADGIELGTFTINLGSDSVKNYTFKFPRIENAIVDINVNVAEGVSNLKQITVLSSSAGTSYKVEGLPAVKQIGQSIELETAATTRIISILAADGSLLGTVTVDVTKDSEKDYTFKDTTTPPPPPTPVNTAPVITVTEPDGVNDGIITLTIGTAFTAPVVTANDAEDGNITSRIVKTGEAAVNTSAAGEYSLKYNVTDLQGVAAVERIVTVKVVADNQVVKTANITVQVAADFPSFKRITVNSSTIGTKFKVDISSNVKAFGQAIDINTSEAARVVYILDEAGNTLGSVTVNVGSSSTQNYSIH